MCISAREGRKNRKDRGGRVREVIYEYCSGVLRARGGGGGGAV